MTTRIVNQLNGLGFRPWLMNLSLHLVPPLILLLMAATSARSRSQHAGIAAVQRSNGASTAALPGTAAEQPAKPAPSAVLAGSALAGTYYRGDGHGDNVTLELAEDGSYSACYYGCMGTYGSASGVWTARNNRITFSPAHEEGLPRIKSLDVLTSRGEFILIPTDAIGRNYYKKTGDDRATCFHKLPTAERSEAKDD